MQIRSGAVAERVAREGVMLQYAVDTKLDVLLSSIYASVTQPPMPLNPYLRLLHFLRAHAARLDLWKVRCSCCQYVQCRLMCLACSLTLLLLFKADSDVCLLVCSFWLC
jgi:hypothetical protein